MARDNFFFDNLQNYGDRLAIISKTGEKLTYFQLVSKMDQFALCLGNPRQLLLIEAVNEIPAIVAYLAALKNRHPVIFLPGMEANNAANATVIQLYEPNWIYQRDAQGNWMLHRHSTKTHNLHPDLAILLSTSGSTGTPKLVRLSQQNIMANAQAIAQYLQIVPEDRAITTLPFHYSYGLSVVNSHLLTGAALLLTEDSVVEAGFWDFFAAYQATSFAGVPYTFELLERIDFQNSKQDVIPQLRYFTQAGGRMPTDKVKAWANWANEKKINFFVMYGQTEATARMAYLPADLVAQYPEYIGLPIPQGEFFLLDEQNQPIQESNQPGKLVYRGPNIMLGYAFSSTDLAKPAELNQLVTGDIAYRNEVGLYRIVGRESRFSKIFGLRIDLDAIEHFLTEQQVKTVVTGNDETIVIAVLTGVLNNELVEKLAQRLKLPPTTFTLLTLDELPLLPSGKVDYKAILTQAASTGQKLANTTENADSLQDSFRYALQTALGLKMLPENCDSFISLGGDSLTYIQVAIVIEKRLGYLPPHWEQMAVVELEKKLPKEKSTFTELNMEILWRTLAIIGVVFTHVNAAVINKLDWQLAGGANLLLLLAGFNTARFQADKLFKGMVAQVVMPFFRKIVLPYYLILIAYQSWRGIFDLPSLLLVGNYYGRLKAFLEPYWFIETIWQVLLVFTALFLVPAYRNIASRYPYLVGLLLFSIALWFREIELWGKIGYAERTPDKLMYIFLAGWCLYFAQNKSQKLVMSLLLLILFAYTQGIDSHYTAWLICGSFSVLWMPGIRMPKPLCAVISSIGAASFYIYLTHIIPIYTLTHITQLQSLQNIFIIISIALLFGVVVQKILTQLGF
jgi:acyl-coenzyme A synthetase/AMP-(fatty) acid ligase